MYYLVIGVSIIIIIVMSLLLKNSSRSLKNLAHLSVMRNVYFPVTIFGWRELRCVENPFNFVLLQKVDLFQKAPNVMSKARDASEYIDRIQIREIWKLYVQFLPVQNTVCNLWNGRFSDLILILVYFIRQHGRWRFTSPEVQSHLSGSNSCGFCNEFYPLFSKEGKKKPSITHCSKSSFFVRKIHFNFPRKLWNFFGWKLVKMLWFWNF